MKEISRNIKEIIEANETRNKIINTSIQIFMLIYRYKLKSLEGMVPLVDVASPLLVLLIYCLSSHSK